MSLQITNTNYQLRVVQNGKIVFYNYDSMKGVASSVDAKNNYYIDINFIANDKENSVRIYLKDVTNQAGWTNDSAGAETAKGDISTWMLDGSSDIVTIGGPLGQQTMAASIPVVLASNQAGVARTPGLVRATGAGTIAPKVYDFSVANVGAANGTILGGTIKVGETLNFGAGSINNFYTAGTISYDGTGTELVIIYNS